MRIKLVALVNGHHLFVTSCVYHFIFFHSLSSSKSNLRFTWIVRRNRCQRPPITNITPIIIRHPLKIYVHLWRRRQINVCLLCCIVRAKPQLNFWLSLSFCSPLSFTQCGSLTPAYSFVPYRIIFRISTTSIDNVLLSVSFRRWSLSNSRHIGDTHPSSNLFLFIFFPLALLCSTVVTYLSKRVWEPISY